MANRYAHNGQDGNKSLAKSQKKYVPKAPNSADPNLTLSNSLRQSDAADTSIPSSTNRVRMGENGDWVSSKIHVGNFVNYLPQDEAVAAGLGADEGGLDPVESQRVVDLLNRELSRLLTLNPREFWREVASDPSFHAFLESFLKFRIRWYDFPHRGVKGIVAGVIVGEYELSRRVFMVLYRISSNRDPGAKAADSLSPKDHAALLQEKKLLDLPKLLDICAIYGNENEDLTRLLVVNALKAQPCINDNFTAVISHFLSIIQTMNQRCSSSLEMLSSSNGREDHGSSGLSADYLEVMDFINDAVVSLDAFVSAYKPAAVFFSCPVEMSYGSEELLSTLGRIHDSLLPSLQRGFRIIFTDGLQETFDDMLSDIALSLKMLSMRIVKFGWKLLDFCYLSDEAFEGSFSLPAATKIFPSKVEDPVVRADILLQILKEINGGYSDIQKSQNRGTFLQNLEKNHRIMSRIDFLQNTGWILMDDEQLQYLSGIMRHPLEENIKEMAHVPNPTTSDKLQRDEDAAIVESKISQIKDLFPDYGKGFLSACLEVYNQNPEEVIQRILEGTLHEDLQSLDISLEEIQAPKSASVSRKDKGKGKLLETATESSTNMVPTFREQQNVASSLSSSSSMVGRYVRKSAVDVPDSETLDCRDENDLAKTAMLITQLEYDDEYDDSFDDLGISVADSGLEDTEILGDKINLNRGKETETTRSSIVNSSNSKWGSRKKPQFYVKDGKNYSYKVEGSVAAANYNEASLVNQSQRELIHGLGRGGNVPLGAVRNLIELNEERDTEPDAAEVGGRGGPAKTWGRGRRRGASNEERDNEPDAAELGGRGGIANPRGRGKRGGGSSEERDNEPDAAEVGGRGSPANPRGRGRRGGGGGGGGNHYRKDRAMRKHFTGLTGH